MSVMCVSLFSVQVPMYTSCEPSESLTAESTWSSSTHLYQLEVCTWPVPVGQLVDAPHVFAPSRGTKSRWSFHFCFCVVFLLFILSKKYNEKSLFPFAVSSSSLGKKFLLLPLIPWTNRGNVTHLLAVLKTYSITFCLLLNSLYCQI